MIYVEGMVKKFGCMLENECILIDGKLDFKFQIEGILLIFFFSYCVCDQILDRSSLREVGFI